MIERHCFGNVNRSDDANFRNSNVVAVGGGNGLSTLLSGLKAFVGDRGDDSGPIKELSAIVAVSDDGGSSGRLREELDMPPPGDIRNCLVALSEDSHLLARLFRHRFSGDGELAGHSCGNLFLAALSEVTGDFSEAVRLSAEILATKGHLYPATSTNVRIAARTADGETIKGETNIGKCGKRIGGHWNRSAAARVRSRRSKCGQRSARIALYKHFTAASRTGDPACDVESAAVKVVPAI